MKILRIATAGSVDDGKSTLIGRLLYDTKSLPSDKLENIKKLSEQKGLSDIDFSLITDGLSAEREQGITIDVAHIYFNTPKRKYIIADSPGHVEYTRNMITGASNANVFVILIDARNGIIEQTKRHLFIAKLLEVQEVLFVINKMDLVDFKEETYNTICDALKKLTEDFEMSGQNSSFFPISAKKGDNITTTSKNTPWYKGLSLLNKLEAIEIIDEENSAFRFDVQYVIRPHEDNFHDFRGYAGRVKSGRINVGDEIFIGQSGLTSKIKSIRKYKEELKTCEKGDSVTIELEDNIDVSRGDLILNYRPNAIKDLKSTICWLNKSELELSGRYFLRHGSAETRIKFTDIHSTLNMETLNFENDGLSIGVNAIAKVSLKSANSLFIQNYSENKENGYFIVIEESSNNTVAVGFSES